MVGWYKSSSRWGQSPSGIVSLSKRYMTLSLMYFFLFVLLGSSFRCSLQVRFPEGPLQGSGSQGRGMLGESPKIPNQLLCHCRCCLRDVQQGECWSRLHRVTTGGSSLLRWRSSFTRSCTCSQTLTWSPSGHMSVRCGGVCSWPTVFTHHVCFYSSVCLCLLFPHSITWFWGRFPKAAADFSTICLYYWFFLKTYFYEGKNVDSYLFSCSWILTQIYSDSWTKNQRTTLAQKGFGNQHQDYYQSNSSLKVNETL